jgi:hypothetical protein
VVKVSGSLSVIYEERNALALALAQLAARQGWPVYIGLDTADPDPAWPTLTIVSPVGQLSYTIPASQVVGNWPGPGPDDPREAIPFTEGLKRLRDIAQGADNG